MNELISVIVPIYGVEKYLEECLKSIINQTYTNLEIILVDDGSPDNCGKICDEYLKKDNRIKVIHKNNGGLSDARNAGLDIANGEYIAFIDSDDCINEEFIQKLYYNCKNYKCDIAEANYIRFSNKISKDKQKENLEIFTNIQMVERIYNRSTYGRTIVVWNKLYKKEIIKQYRFQKGKIHEDEFIMYKIFYENDIKIAVLNEILYYYRFTPNSIMNQKFDLRRLDKLEAYEERMKYFLEKKETNFYYLTLDKYLSTILNYYALAKDSKDIQNILMDKFKKNYEIIWNFKNITLIKKIRYKLSYKQPKINYGIKKLKTLLKKG